MKVNILFGDFYGKLCLNFAHNQSEQKANEQEFCAHNLVLKHCKTFFLKMGIKISIS